MLLADIIADRDEQNADPFVSRVAVCQRIGTLIAFCESIFRFWRETHRARRT